MVRAPMFGVFGQFEWSEVLPEDEGTRGMVLLGEYERNCTVRLMSMAEDGELWQRETEGRNVQGENDD